MHSAPRPDAAMPSLKDYYDDIHMHIYILYICVCTGDSFKDYHDYLYMPTNTGDVA